LIEYSPIFRQSVALGPFSLREEPDRVQAEGN
jgi:hypothetical protein